MGKLKAAIRACHGTAANKSLQGHGRKELNALQTKKKAQFGGATKSRGSRLVAKRALAEALKIGNACLTLVVNILMCGIESACLHPHFAPIVQGPIGSHSDRAYDIVLM
jgi:hypothetical protein